jgi:hypothetical protein
MQSYHCHKNLWRNRLLQTGLPVRPGQYQQNSDPDKGQQKVNTFR